MMPLPSRIASWNFSARVAELFVTRPMFTMSRPSATTANTSNMPSTHRWMTHQRQ